MNLVFQQRIDICQEMKNAPKESSSSQGRCFYLLGLITWAGGLHIPCWGSSRGSPWLHGVVRNDLRCGLGDILRSDPSIAHREHVSELRCGCRMPGLSRSIRPRTQCRASSNCNAWHVPPARFLVAAVLPHHPCAHNNGRNTDHIWLRRRQSGSQH